MGVSDIARRADVPTSTAFRLLAYLVEGGFVAKDDTLYRPGDKLFELGNQVAMCRPLVCGSRRPRTSASSTPRSGMTVRMAVLDGTEIVIVNKIVGLRTLPAPTAIGGRTAALCTALGKALLAFQPAERITQLLRGPLPRRTRHSVVNPRFLQRRLIETRSTRLAYDQEESVLGQVCVATPILRDGTAVAAISLSAPTHQVNQHQAGVALLRAASRLERALKP